ncbi:MAG: glycosyltransferase family 2 protein [Rhodospirillales bacterium]|nr:MAG: glycosyltransferase family 2 protein [Rhodospirillales bacterium]
MTDTPRISVVVTTYNRADTLRETLACLARQDLAPTEFEVVVADDESPDNTPDVVSELSATLPIRIRSIRHPNRGPGYTQNRGIEAASAPLVLLIADDIWLKPQALRAHLESHDCHPEPEVAVLGRVVQSPRLTDTVFLRMHNPFRFEQFDGLEWLPGYLFWACNISFKRAFMLTHGMFREDHGPGGLITHEDAELGHRLGRRGLRIRYQPAALAEHYHHETLDHVLNRAYQRGLNFRWLRTHASAPEITVRYHVLGRWTYLADHGHALRQPGRPGLIGVDRNPLKLVGLYAARAIMFNCLTVPGLWLPLARAAERNHKLARLMRPWMYRGMVNWHFNRGCAEDRAAPPAVETRHAAAE